MFFTLEMDIQTDIQTIVRSLFYLNPLDEISSTLFLDDAYDIKSIRCKNFKLAILVA